MKNIFQCDFLRAVGDNGGLLLRVTPRRHVVAEMDPSNHAVEALRARLLSEAVQSCRADEQWQCGLCEGDQRKIARPKPFEIWEPLIHTGTASYQDNKECLLAIDNKVMTEGGDNLASIVVGGEQTLDRMVKRRRNMPFIRMGFTAVYAHVGSAVMSSPA